MTAGNIFDGIGCLPVRKYQMPPRTINDKPNKIEREIRDFIL
jgi:hypothetical protein